MTLTPRRTANQIHAAQTILERLDRLPAAVAAVHDAVAYAARTGGPRPKNEISDPTGAAAVSSTTMHERVLSDLDDQLRSLALTLSLLTSFVERWAPQAVDHPRCNTTACEDYVEHSVRNDGSISYRGSGKCVKCRKAIERTVVAA